MSASDHSPTTAQSKLGRWALGLLRLVVVAAAIAVPASVLWQHRDVAFPAFSTVAAATTETGWASLVLGAPSGAPARPLPELESQPTPIDDAAHVGTRSGDRSNGRRAVGSSSAGDLGADVGEDRAQSDGRPPHRPFLPAPSPVDPRDQGHQGSGGARGATNVEPPLELRAFPDDFEVRVARNLTLGEIAQAHYGTSRPTVVKALATYNGLDDPNKLRAGQTLRVPDRAKLGLD